MTVVHRISHAVLVTPVSARLAAIGALVSFGVALGSGAGVTGRPLVGGIVAFVIPYVGMTVLLRAHTVGAKAAGTTLAAIMTWLPSSGLISFVAGIQQPRTPTAIGFLLLVVIGAVVTLYGAGELAHATVWTGYWKATPWAARLAFGHAIYLLALFIADTYFTANPPVDRQLLLPVLFVLSGASALMLRGPAVRELTAGALLAGAGVAWTALYAALRPQYVAWVAQPPAVIDISYYSLLPWPLLLAVSLAFGMSIAAIGFRQAVVAKHPRPRRGLA